jgi:uncharacterized protein YoxC
MIIEISVVVIALTFLALAIYLIKLTSQAQRSIQLMQMDVQNMAIELLRLVQNANQFISTDLHSVSEETTQLIHKLTDLSSDINNKSHSLNFLFKPFSFLTSKLSGDSSSDKNVSIPQLLKWIASGVLLIKATKGFIHGKRK